MGQDTDRAADTAVERAKRPRSLHWPAVAVFLAFISVLLVFHEGKSLGFDTANYEFSSGYSAIHGFGSWLSLPGQLQTYLDPQINGFYYLLIVTFEPRWVDAIIATLQSLSVTALAFCAWTIARDRTESKVLASWVAGVAGASAVLAPNYYSELGSTFSDVLLTLPLVVAAGVLFRVLASRATSREVALPTVVAGSLLGVVTALKFTNATYAVAIVISFGVALLVMGSEPLRRRAGLLIRLVVAVAAGFAVVYTPEGLLLERRYQDPLFPYFNGIFHSQYLQPGNWRDPAYATTSFGLFWSHTLHLIVGGNTAHNGISEYPVRSPLLFLSLIVVAVFLVLDIASWRNRSTLFLEMSILVSYVLWDAVFGYYRYLGPLEVSILSGVLVLVLLHFKHPIVPVALLTVMVGLSPLYSIYTDWGRGSFAGSFFSVPVRQIDRYSSSRVLLAGPGPIGFVDPYLPRSATVIRIGGNLTGIMSVHFWRSVDESVRSADASWTVIFAATQPSEASDDLRSLGLPDELTHCRTFSTSVMPLAACKSAVIS